MLAALHPLFRPVQANGRVPAYRYAERLPSPALRPYVACYWLSEPASSGPTAHPGDDEAIDRVLPDGCTDILFEYELLHRRCRIRYAGFDERPFAIEYRADRPAVKFGIRFFPGGAFPFLRFPLSEFSGMLLPLDEAWPGFGKGIAERIFESENMDGKVRAAERFLLSRLQASGSPVDDTMGNLLFRIFRSGGNVGVTELAAAEGISSRQMNRKFDRWIGANPKTFCEIVRFQTVLRQIGGEGRPDWLALALDRGFYDQSHLNREFKRFYGASPTAAFREFRGMSDLSKRSGSPFP
ncbi:helix-turn-helix domain-containing protein [Cohnella caldifontis]|uniref:helix-turn-helix domain-containing protein n=1 Tax=Cohnella caldifontis TaxID=3027471 RepID=UPI0023EC50C0|nr:helix-turn-helix domain-containing protein [Cohnella sp. YIM B05605]